MKGIIIIVSIIRMMMSVVGSQMIMIMIMMTMTMTMTNDYAFTDTIKLNSIQIRHDRWYYGWLLT